MKDADYDESFRVLRGLMSDFPQNHALYAWAEQWYVDQEKLTDGVEYFEKLHAEKLTASPRLAQQALYHKADLQYELDRRADARATLTRLRALGTPDPALGRTLTAFEKELR
jgi:predicted Zn-dependent protease